MIAPIHTGLAMAVLAACFLCAAALAQGQAYVVTSCIIEFSISAGENDNRCMRTVADSGLAGSSIFGFSGRGHHRDWGGGGVISTITLEPQSAKNYGAIPARSPYADDKGSRLGPVRRLGHDSKEMSSAPAAGPEDNLVNRGSATLAKYDWKKTAIRLAERRDPYSVGLRRASG